MDLPRETILYKWLNILALYTPDLSPCRQTHTSLKQHFWGIHQAWSEECMDWQRRTRRLVSSLQHVACSCPFSLPPAMPQPHTHPIWSLLIHRKSQASCSLSIQEMTAKVYSRNYIQWVRREKTHLLWKHGLISSPSNGVFQTPTIPLALKIRSPPWISSVWFQQAMQPDQYNCPSSPPLLFWSHLL